MCVGAQQTQNKRPREQKGDVTAFDRGEPLAPIYSCLSCEHSSRAARVEHDSVSTQKRVRCLRMPVLSTRSRGVVEEAEHLGKQLGVGSHRPWLRTIRRRLMHRYCIPYVITRKTSSKVPAIPPKTLIGSSSSRVLHVVHSRYRRAFPFRVPRAANMETRVSLSCRFFVSYSSLS